MHPILQEIRSLDTGRDPLRSFGRVVGAVLLALSAIAYWKSGTDGWAPGLAGSGTVLVVLGQFAPFALVWPYRVWMALASVLGFVMTRVILTAVFYLLVTPIGLIMRALGRNTLERKPDASLESYWIERDPAEKRPMTKYY